MKQDSPFFNKKSRLIKAPELDTTNAARLAAFSPAAIRKKLPELLTAQNDFFPCFDWVFPPPLLSKSAPPDNADELFAEASVIPDRYAIYLHSPFCKSLCSFCYYAIIPGRGVDMAEKYVDHLIKEMALYSETFKGQVCESIYFGGGTPSFLDNALLTRIFNGLQHYFDISDDAEITIESAPGSLPRDKCELLKSLGVNRLSYGIQTLEEELLSGMNRDYQVHEAIEELSHAIDIIGNVNVDTMYGFDGETEDTLISTLSRFHDIGVPSFSIYALDKQRSQGKVLFEPPRDDHYEKKISQFARAEEFLKNLGYKPVLQNIFIDPDRASYRHQLRRWDNLPLIAMGINSQGYAPQRAYQNTGSLKSYYQMINEGKLPLATMDELDSELELCRELTSKLRFTYVSLGEFKYKYGVSITGVFTDLIGSLVELGYLECHNDILRMTDKAAYYNNIIPMLFAPDKFKEKLMGLPEEYLETFPVPYIMTQLGCAQSAPFNLANDQHVVNSDRRIRCNRRRGIAADNNKERRITSGRRSIDGMWKWSTTNNLAGSAQ
ncbi:MAG: coproporphyrinogen-III oxidase family protein [Gammaproteobacteria bacterium]|nr:coproporphyrinogen-III oxidase family protein [Gammaproteobacteria bacterium]